MTRLHLISYRGNRHFTSGMQKV